MVYENHKGEGAAKRSFLFDKGVWMQKLGPFGESAGFKEKRKDTAIRRKISGYVLHAYPKRDTISQYPS